jgi:hypothetical protein
VLYNGNWEDDYERATVVASCFEITGPAHEKVILAATEMWVNMGIVQPPFERY